MVEVSLGLRGSWNRICLGRQDGTVDHRERDPPFLMGVDADICRHLVLQEVIVIPADSDMDVPAKMVYSNLKAMQDANGASWMTESGEATHGLQVHARWYRTTWSKFLSCHEHVRSSGDIGEGSSSKNFGANESDYADGARGQVDARCDIQHGSISASSWGDQARQLSHLLDEHEDVFWKGITI